MAVGDASMLQGNGGHLEGRLFLKVWIWNLHSQFPLFLLHLVMMAEFETRLKLINNILCLGPEQLRSMYIM